MPYSEPEGILVIGLLCQTQFVHDKHHFEHMELIILIIVYNPQTCCWFLGVRDITKLKTEKEVLWSSWLRHLRQVTGILFPSSMQREQLLSLKKKMVWEESEKGRKTINENLTNHSVPQRKNAVLCQYCLECRWGADDLDVVER